MTRLSFFFRYRYNWCSSTGQHSPPPQVVHIRLCAVPSVSGRVPLPHLFLLQYHLQKQKVNFFYVCAVFLRKKFDTSTIQHPLLSDKNSSMLQMCIQCTCNWTQNETWALNFCIKLFYKIIPVRKVTKVWQSNTAQLLRAPYFCISQYHIHYSLRIRVYWYFRVIKLTSPNLNYVIILGAVLLMVGNVFVPSPSTDLSLIAVFCPVSPVTSSSMQTVWLISLHHPHCLSSPLSLSLSLSLICRFPESSWVLAMTYVLLLLLLRR